MEVDNEISSPRKLSGLAEDSYKYDAQKYLSEKRYLQSSRYDDNVVGSSPLPLNFPAESTSLWKIKRKIKTQDIILVLCLNFELVPEESVEGYCVGDECWINLNSLIAKRNTFRYIALTLQKQYENQIHSSSGLHTKHLLDPSLANVESVCEEVCSSPDKGNQYRVLFHYNGHGVPPPTDLGEIWVFNKRFDKYKPVPISIIHSWLKVPSLFVMDCNCAGGLLNHLMDLNTDTIEEETKDTYFLGACDTLEMLPVHPDFPADIFTACLTDPLRISIRWYLYVKKALPFSLTQNLMKGDDIEEDFAYRMEGGNYDKESPRGKLRLVFDCITDCIAWSVCDAETYKSLFKTDEMVASLFRNFFLAQRIMGFFNCHPVSKPAFPDMSEHVLWRTWDSVLEDFLCQYSESQKSFSFYRNEAFQDTLKIPRLNKQHPYDEQSLKIPPEFAIISAPTEIVAKMTDEEKYPNLFARSPESLPPRIPSDNASTFVNIYSNRTFVFRTNFFQSVIRELYSFIKTSRQLSEIPSSFPMLSQLLNSDEMSQQISFTETINVIDLLADLAERSTDAVLAILISVNFATLKRISFRAQKHHRSALLRLWTCITAFDYRVNEDLVQSLFMFLISFLRVDADPIPSEDDITRVMYLLCVACRQNDLARVKCKENGVQQCIKKYLRSSSRKMRCWTCLLLSQLCYEYNDMKEYLFYDAIMNDVLELLVDPYPEVRAASILFMQSFVGFSSTDTASAADSIHVSMSSDDIENLVGMKDPSIKRDQTMLESISKRVLMNRECSVLVRRELLRLIMKVFCRRGHMARMICFVDRVLKNELDTSTMLDQMNNGGKKRQNSNERRDPNQFYLKYWIMFMSLRDTEPHQAIRNAAAHYVNIIYKNVDNLKNKGVLPVTTSIFDFASLAQMASTNLSTRSSLRRQTSLMQLPTLSSPRESPTPIHMPDIAEEQTLPLLSTSRAPTSQKSTAQVNMAPPNGGLPLIVTAATRQSIFGNMHPTLHTLSTSPLDQSNTRNVIPTVSTSRTPPRNSLRSSIIPSSISSSPSFGNLELLAPAAAPLDSSSHIDSWLEVQLGLAGLPQTFMEWCMNEFVERPAVTKVRVSDEQGIMGWCCKREESVSSNEMNEYVQMKRCVSLRKATRVAQKDVFHVDEAKIACIKFHPYYSIIAIGANNTVMLYDYQDKRHIYSLDCKLATQTTSIEWINPSSSSLILQATKKGSVHIWNLPPLDKHQTPHMISSFIAFPIFTKSHSTCENSHMSMVLDWNQSSGLLATAGSTQMVKVWDLDQERLVCCKETGFQVPVVSVKSIGNFTYYCCLTNGRMIRMDTRCKEVSQVYSTSLGADNRFVGMSFTSEGNVAIGEFSGKLSILDPRVFSEITSTQLTRYMSSIDSHPNFSEIVATSFQSELTLCDGGGNKFQSIRSLDGFRAASLGNLQSVALHPLDSSVASYNTNGIVYVYQ